MKITAGILAGGKSSRMGCDKARVRRGGETFLSHLAEELREFDEILLSVERAADWPDTPYPLAKDELRGFGSVEGIYQLLRRAKFPWLFVAAVDLQRLDASFLRALAAQLTPEDRCLVPVNGGFLEPLCAVYHRDALPVLEEMRRTGVRRPRAVFDRVPTRFITLEELGAKPETVANINTPEELLKLEIRNEK